MYRCRGGGMSTSWEEIEGTGKDGKACIVSIVWQIVN
jgi:hypothetical protein